MLTKDDKDLMLDFQEGTDEAMPILYQRYLKRIFSFCLRILGNRPDAEDVTQEVFINPKVAFEHLN
jgi:RNA polymerase sigma-70 factor (ECF subfamily)